MCHPPDTLSTWDSVPADPDRSELMRHLSRKSHVQIRTVLRLSASETRQMTCTRAFRHIHATRGLP